MMNLHTTYRSEVLKPYPFLSHFIQETEYVHGYETTTALAIHTTGKEGGWLAIEGELSPTEYMAILHACITSGCSIPRVSVPRDLAQQLRINPRSEWVWFLKRQPYPPRAIDPRIQKITDNSYDKLITQLLKLSSPRASAMPGVDPVDFWLVAIVDGQVVGSIASTIYPNRHAHLASLAVHPDFRRRGLAKELTIRAIQESFALNVNGVSLGVYQNNQHALDLYRALDFDHEIAFTSFDLDSKG